VSGFLEQVLFKPGAAVKKGDLLFVIDPRVYEAQARQAEADLETRKANLRLAEITLKHLQDAKTGAVSQQEMDTAVGQRDASNAQVNLAQAALASAKLNVEFTQVRAPIDGRITKNLVDIGNLVGAAGQPTVLATVVSSRPLYVSIDASESDVLMVRRERLAQASGAEPGQVAPGEWRQAEIATAGSEDFNVRGRIDYVDPALDPQSGTIRVRTRFENENGFLLPGVFVRLRILLDTSDAVLVPDIALFSDQNGRFALIVNDKNVVELRRVKIGVLDGAMRVVVDGLAVTDRIIVNGLQRARPGVTVKPTLKEVDAPKTPAKASAPSETDDGHSAPAGGRHV